LTNPLLGDPDAFYTPATTNTTPGVTGTLKLLIFTCRL